MYVKNGKVVGDASRKAVKLVQDNLRQAAKQGTIEQSAMLMAKIRSRLALRRVASAMLQMGKDGYAWRRALALELVHAEHPSLEMLLKLLLRQDIPDRSKTVSAIAWTVTENGSPFSVRGTMAALYAVGAIDEIPLVVGQVAHDRDLPTFLAFCNGIGVCVNKSEQIQS